MELVPISALLPSASFVCIFREDTDIMPCIRAISGNSEIIEGIQDCYQLVRDLVTKGKKDISVLIRCRNDSVYSCSDSCRMLFFLARPLGIRVFLLCEHDDPENAFVIAPMRTYTMQFIGDQVVMKSNHGDFFLLF
jgi:hypothetical protein